MKTNRIQKGIAAILAVIMCLAFMPLSADEAKADEVSLLEQNSVEMFIGNKSPRSETVYLTDEAYFTDGYRITEAVSNDTNIATVTHNTISVSITPAGIGETNVDLTIASDSETKTESIAVKVSAPPFSINLDTIEYDGVDVDYCEELYYTGSYDDDIIKAVSNNTNVAKVVVSQDEYYEGSRYEVVPTGIGTTTITCTSKYGKKIDIPVTVNAPELELSRTSIEMDGVEEFPVEIYNYNSKTDIASVSISDSSIATVKRIKEGGEYYCEVTPLRPGTAVITITDIYGSKKTVNVNIGFPPLELNVGSKISFDKYDYDEGLPECIRYCGDFKSDLASAVSRNTSIITVKKYSDEDGTEFDLLPKKAGTTTVVITDIYGTKKEIQVSVTQKYMDEKNYGDEIALDIDPVKYGGKVIVWITSTRATVTATVNGKTYKGKQNFDGWYEISIPLCKIGTSVTVTSSCGLAKDTKTVKVTSNTPKIVINKVKSSSRKVTGYVKDVHKGDKVIIKVGKKSYTKKVTKNKSKFKYSVKIKKQKKKTKIKVTVKNKFKQKLSIKTTKVK